MEDALKAESKSSDIGLPKCGQAQDADLACSKSSGSLLNSARGSGGGNRLAAIEDNGMGQGLDACVLDEIRGILAAKEALCWATSLSKSDVL